MIFQDPMTFLNPLLTAGEQVSEAIRRHQGLDRSRPATKCSGSFGKSASRVRSCATAPIRISSRGAQAARDDRHGALIASGIADRRRADDRTRRDDPGSDPGASADLQRDYGMSILLITHDLGVIAEICDRVAVMYAGRIVEQAPINALFDDPEHPYTLGLMNAIPRPDLPILPRSQSKVRHRTWPSSLGMSLPSALSLSGADLHRRRSPCVRSRRDTRPHAISRGEKRFSHSPRCMRRPRIDEATHGNGGPPLLEVRNLVKHFPVRGSLGDTLLRRPRAAVRAVDGVSFSVGKGENARARWRERLWQDDNGRCVLFLQQPTSGEVFVNGSVSTAR